MALSPFVYARHVYFWGAWIAWLWAGAARAGTFPSFNKTPTTVNDFQAALTTAFVDRTALLLANATDVVGGTGSTEGRLVLIECSTPAEQCFSDGSGDYVAVLEEALLPDVLRLLSTQQEAGSMPSIPSAIIALPSSDNISFSPASVSPFVQYQSGSAGGTAMLHRWNTGGAALLDLAVPCGVFLAPREEASVIERHTKSNNERGWSGAEFGSSVKLKTMIDLDNNSVECVPARTCAPLGGYSVWASMPPHNNSTGVVRKQLLVLSHWDSQGLFRSIISGTHSAQSGLIAMLLAADILSKHGQALNYERDIIFTALSGEAFDLMASRKLLYDLQHKQEDPRAAENLEGISLTNVHAIVEVGMLGYDAGAYNGTGGSGGGLFVHTTATQSPVLNAFLAAGNASSSASTVSRSSQAYLPPSSLLLWQKALPDMDAVYLGDFDSEFSNKRFWNHNDDGLIDWSPSQVARAATILAEALHSLATGSAADTELQVDLQAVEAHATELFKCLSKPGGLQCDLVMGMTDPFKGTAEQFVSVLVARPDDEQDVRKSKKNIEVFVWEYLANRTHVGTPEQVLDGDEAVDCRHTKHPCSPGQVCLHEFGGPGKPGGKCVNATVKFTPSHSTLFTYHTCESSGEDGEDTSCNKRWDVADSDEPSQWASRLSLPPDAGWAETYNEKITVDVNLRETSRRDLVVLVAGLCCTVVVLAVVLVGKTLHGRFKID